MIRFWRSNFVWLKSWANFLFWKPQNYKDTVNIILIKISSNCCGFVVCSRKIQKQFILLVYNFNKNTRMYSYEKSRMHRVPFFHILAMRLLFQIQKNMAKSKIFFISFIQMVYVFVLSMKKLIWANKRKVLNRKGSKILDMFISWSNCWVN